MPFIMGLRTSSQAYHLVQPMSHFTPRLNRLIERFLPEEFDRDNRTEMLRVKLVVSYLLFVTLLNVIVPAIGLIQQNYDLVLDPLSFAFLSAIGLWFIKYRGKYRGFVTLFIALGIGNIVKTSFDLQGILSPGIYMLIPLPSIALLLAGRKSCIFIFSISLVAFSIIEWYNPATAASERLIMQISSMIISTIATYIFDYLNHRALKQITESSNQLALANKKQEAINKKLGTTNKQLETVNRQLETANQEQAIINKALEEARKEAEQALEFRNAFLATMSHEIRTPMNGVIGMTSLLHETPLNPEQRDYIDTIRVSGDALLTIINDILDFSKIESGNLELEKQPFSVRQCIEEALDLLALKAEQKHLELIYHANIPLQDHIVGDITRLRQILVNLVNNAIKFTPEGSVIVGVEAISADEAGTPRLAFSIRDTGIGIPEERMDRLFKPFSQVDASTTRQYGGTGLGLAISKRLCEAMGGTITVSSQIDKGSEFSFTILAPPAERQPALTDLNGLHVLVIESLPMSSVVLAHELELRGARVTNVATMDDIPEGIEPDRIISSFAHEREVHHPPSLPETLQHIPLLLLAPSGEKLQSATSSPSNPLPPHVFIQSKPIKPERIARMLKAKTGHSSSIQSEFDPPTLLSNTKALRILLVEDNLINQKVATRLLERLGYVIDIAGNGLEAIDALVRQSYDVVFMDMQMPEMDGLEATRRIRANTTLKQPYIIAMTANAMEQDRQRCNEAGMDDFVAKPVTLTDLTQALKRSPGSLSTPSPIHQVTENKATELDATAHPVQ